MQLCIILFVPTRLQQRLLKAKHFQNSTKKHSWVRFLKVQSDSESSSVNMVELNSATEISTDSEFENDEMRRDAPKIFIDDTHLRKPTKVQVKSMVVSPSKGNKLQAVSKGGSYLQKYQQQSHQLHQTPQPEFKPLIQVDPTLLISNRLPLQNIRQGDYSLNKTASTEGIASKKSLELKKRYLLGEQDNGNKIQKSGSTSVLDSRIRTFQSNISECQKLLNPGNDISPSMKTFLDRTRLAKVTDSNVITNDKSNDLSRSATSNLLNELKVQITIQKASSQTLTDNEKKNNFVNDKNNDNQDKEFTENFDCKLFENLNKISPTTPTPTNNLTIIETIDLVSPDKRRIVTIDLTHDDASNKELENCESKEQSVTHQLIDLTGDSPLKNDQMLLENSKPDVSKDVREIIPDILDHIEKESQTEKSIKLNCLPLGDENKHLLTYSDDEEKKDDSPEKNEEQYEGENETLQIEVPTIPWSKLNPENFSTTGSSNSSNCTSTSSSLEDIQHYILESTTSPDTNTGGSNNKHNVPRVEIHDTSGALMQIDSLMIIDGKYIGDPDDLEYIEIPEGVIVPEPPVIKTIELEEDNELEPITATPEPAEPTVIEAKEKPSRLIEQEPPLPETGPPKIIPSNFKFDTKNENKIESLKNLPLILEQTEENSKAIKPSSLDLRQTKHRSPETPSTPKAFLPTPSTPLTDNDKTPTLERLSKGSDSETEPTGTGQGLTETELSDWTADDCISESFVEFLTDSNKGTIKRNKKNKKKIFIGTSNLQCTSKFLNEVSGPAPVADFDGILKAIDMEDIEFMDTGSDGSCAEAYAATNTTLLKNRGYVEFIETLPNQTPSHKLHTASPSISAAQSETITVKYKPIIAKKDEKLGVDYIEQGAYIMEQVKESIISPDLLKTPVNESPLDKMTSSNIMTQSLTDSSTLNEIEDDSLLVGNSQTPPSTSKMSKAGTTEDSEALTLVTNPSSPKHFEDDRVQSSQKDAGTGGESSTPSSSDLNPKTSQSTGSSSNNIQNGTITESGVTSNTNTNTNNSSSGKSTSRQSSKDSEDKIYSQRIPSSEEFSYEEYVRVLQQKITQISTARDSIESRKYKRKSSKGEAPFVATPNNGPTVIDTTTNFSAKNAANMSSKSTALIPCTSNPTSLLEQKSTKVPEIPTLTRKLEEITKERTKQKDLIHDLVMDKLQSKKQLNAEKRLHRSRQRSLISGYTSGSSLSPTPKIAAASETNGSNCTSQAHYHVSTADSNIEVRSPLAKSFVSSTIPSSTTDLSQVAVTNSKDKNALQKSATYVSPYGLRATCSPNRYQVYKQRPFSENIDPEQLNAFENYKLSKTPSFSYALAKPVTQSIYSHVKSAPISKASDYHPKFNNFNSSDKSVTVSTENLRTEARARAKLKSNSELGLSPDEKMKLLRKRLHYAPSQEFTKNLPKHDLHLEQRDRKMSTSKSVNDLTFAENQQGQLQLFSKLRNGKSSSSAKSTTALTELSSDQNLTASPKSSPQIKKSKRHKDPERRKSLIQSISSFFQKGSSNSSSSNPLNVHHNHNHNTNSSSAQPELCSINDVNGASSISNSVDGMFSRFRLASKSKEKSKSCFDLGRGFGFGDKIIGSATNNKANPCIQSNERSASQEYISTKPINNIATSNLLTKSNNNIYRNDLQHKTHQQNSPKAVQKHSDENTQNKKSISPSSQWITSTSANAKRPIKAATNFSSSSPQLNMHSIPNNNIYTHNKAASIDSDEQIPPPIPPLPLNYQRSDDESNTNETREQKRQRAITKAARQAELKRLRIAQEIQREQEEIEVQLKELEARGVLIEKALRGESNNTLESSEPNANDEKLLKELLEIWRNITQLKKRDEELSIRQQELQLEHRHAQLKEELNLRLSSNKLDKSSADVAAEGAILNEMLEIVAKRAALRPTGSDVDLSKANELPTTSNKVSLPTMTTSSSLPTPNEVITISARSSKPRDRNESNI